MRWAFCQIGVGQFGTDLLHSLQHQTFVHNIPNICKIINLLLIVPCLNTIVVLVLSVGVVFCVIIAVLFSSHYRHFC